MMKRHPCFAAAAFVAIALSPLISSAFAQDAPAGWTPDWSDEFSGTALDTNRWGVLSRQDSYNNEKQYYTPNAVSVSNGQLNIKATNVALGNKAYQSGLIQTNVQQTYGRWEVRASLPAGQGMWPAIWLLPQNATWPTGGEIDIMENKGNSPGVVGSAYHWGTSVATHAYVSQNFSYADNGTPVSFQGSMHTYAVEWDPSRVRYLVDNVPSFTIYHNIPISSTPMSLILNLAVGGDYGGDPNSSTQFPQTMNVDSVHVFDRDNTTRALENGSFENKSGTLFQNWDEYSNGGGNVLADSVAANAHTGSTAVQMYGKFNGTSTNTSGLFQEMPALPGEVFQLGEFSQNRPGDLLAGGNNARIRIEFIDANGAVIGTSGQLTVATATSPAAYREAVLRRTAPANTKFARAVLEMQQINNGGGAVDFDDASLRLYTASANAGDINLDGVRDASDLDALQHSLTADNTAFNFNGDGTVDAADVDTLLTSAFSTVRGDANLDHTVNFSDLLSLAQNFGKVATGHWSIGDFNGDSNVDFADLLTIAQNFGFGTASTTPDDFAADWALAQSLVPEPTLVTSVLAGGALFLRRRRG